MVAIQSLIEALPDVQQPIYGHPELSLSASDLADERLAAILRACSALEAELGRPLKVIDLACAQGYYCFHLASKGHRVTGVDCLAANIEACEAIQNEQTDRCVDFRCATAEETIGAINPGEFDVALGLGIFHHICFRHGLDEARRLFNELVDKVPLVIVELALADEPAAWAPFLPGDERELVQDAAFVHELARFPTHISELRRPMLVCSDRYWYLGGRLGRFESWSLPHRFAHDIDTRRRRYFFGGGLMVKLLRKGAFEDHFGADLVQEAAFLTNPVPGLAAPRLDFAGENDADAWLVRELLPGVVLKELIAGGVAYDTQQIASALLEQLCLLEEHGLYHSDVRVWNILVDASGQPFLIDFGAITGVAKDRVWPHNLILSFIVFLHELCSGSLPTSSYQRRHFISPYTLPDPFKGWIETLWRQPVDTWTFALLRNICNGAHDDAGQVEPNQQIEAWARALEGFVTELSDLAVRGVHEKEEKILFLDRAAQSLRRSLLQKEHEIDRLSGAAEQLRGQTIEKTRAIEALNESAQALQADLLAKDAALLHAHRAAGALREQLAEKEAQIDMLSAASAQLHGELEARERALEVSAASQLALYAELEARERALEASEASHLALHAEAARGHAAMQGAIADLSRRLAAVSNTSAAPDP